MIYAVLCGLVGALAFRIRGGLLDNSVFGYGVNIGGGQMSRLFFCVVAALCLVAGGEARWYVIVLVIAAWFIGCIIGLWDSIGLASVRDYLVLGLRGFVWVAPAAAVLTAFGYVPIALAVAGLSMPLLYGLAKLVPLKLKGLGKGGFTEIGEALTGFAFCFTSYYAVYGGLKCYSLSFLFC